MKVPEPRKLPSGKWFIQMRLGGVSYSVTEDSAKECKQKAAMMKSNYLAGKKIESCKPEKQTLQTIMQRYVDSRKKVCSPSTIRGYQTIIDNRFQNYIDKKPSEIRNWQKLIDDEILDGVSTKTIKNSWSFLSAALKYADIELPTVVRLPDVVSEERDFLDHEQIRIFVDAVHGTAIEIPALLALHSLRRSEIMGLTWDRVSLDEDTITVSGSAVFDEENKLVYKKTNKNKTSRRVVPIMIPELKAALESVPEKTGKVVTCNPNTIWAAVNRVCKMNNLPEVGVHGLRHSFASLAYHIGMSELETMKLGGWADPGTMRKIYTHLSESDRLKASNKMKLFYQNEKSENKNF